MLQRCSSVLAELMENEFSWAFSMPIDPVALGIPDYFEIVKKPMDLGTIQRKLDECSYDSAESFKDDVILVFNNAKSYSIPSSDIYKMAESLHQLFLSLWEKEEEEEEQEQVVLDTTSNAKMNLPKATTASLLITDSDFTEIYNESVNKLDFEIKRVPKERIIELYCTIGFQTVGRVTVRNNLDSAVSNYELSYGPSSHRSVLEQVDVKNGNRFDFEGCPRNCEIISLLSTQ